MKDNNFDTVTFICPSCLHVFDKRYYTGRHGACGQTWRSGENAPRDVYTAVLMDFPIGCENCNTMLWKKTEHRIPSLAE